MDRLEKKQLCNEGLPAISLPEGSIMATPCPAVRQGWVRNHRLPANKAYLACEEYLMGTEGL